MTGSLNGVGVLEKLRCAIRKSYLMLDEMASRIFFRRSSRLSLSSSLSEVYIYDNY